MSLKRRRRTPVTKADSVPESLKCVVCKGRLRDAMQTSCGCKICCECSKEYFREGDKPCPGGDQLCSDTALNLDRDIFKDIATRKELDRAEKGGKIDEFLFVDCESVDFIDKLELNYDCWRGLLQDLKVYKKEHEDLENETRTLRVNVDKMVARNSELKMSYEKLANSIDSITRSVISNGPYVWKIEDFDQMQLEAKNGNAVFRKSDEFFTKNFGYKMKLFVHLLGEGYLSVYFVLIKGENDDFLAWPFQDVVTVSLLDQDNKEEHWFKTRRPDLDSNIFQRPTGDSNRKAGWNTFIELSKMAPNSKYNKKGTVYLRITVESNT